MRFYQLGLNTNIMFPTIFTVYFAVYSDLDSALGSLSCISYLPLCAHAHFSVLFV